MEEEGEGQDEGCLPPEVVGWAGAADWGPAARIRGRGRARCRSRYTPRSDVGPAGNRALVGGEVVVPGAGAWGSLLRGKRKVVPRRGMGEASTGATGGRELG